MLRNKNISASLDDIKVETKHTLLGEEAELIVSKLINFLNIYNYNDKRNIEY